MSEPTFQPVLGFASTTASFVVGSKLSELLIAAAGSGKAGEVVEILGVVAVDAEMNPQDFFDKIEQVLLEGKAATEKARMATAPAAEEPKGEIPYLSFNNTDANGVKTEVFRGRYIPNTLELNFNGTPYQYFDVRPEVWESLLKAERPRKFFQDNIRGKFKYAKVEQ